MKWNRRTFGRKLWLWFLLFTAVIFGALWLLQTVFLQHFYDGMVIRNAERVAGEIARQQDRDDLAEIIADYAASDSLLIFLTDWEGTILYSADEHNAVYTDSLFPDDSGEDGNPYRDGREPMSWQIGAYRNLPAGYSAFLAQLSASETGSVGYRTEQGDAYIYGLALPAGEAWGPAGAALYISMPLGAVGAAVSILRIQLFWVTLASLVLGFLISFLISKQFAKPVASITTQAKGMATGNSQPDYKKGFCLELDELSDTLSETSAELSRLEHARQELLANVSHDLRTPLTMIKGYAEMVREISWSDDAQRDADLSVIIRETDRLTALVNDILDYSALQQQPAPLLQPMDLSAAAQYVADQFVPLCAQKGCEITVSIEPNLWVAGAEAQLKRVLYNFLDNAVGHTIQNVTLSLAAQGDSVRAEVRDRGPGIPQEELPYIWDRYFTARQRRDSSGHSGLGLAIAKNILLGHGAKFGVDSAPGQGTAFWFVLEKLPDQPK